MGGLTRRGGVATAIVRAQQTKGHGRNRTKGRYVYGALDGTQLKFSERCDGSTSVRVYEGTVTVFDRARRRTVKVRAGRTLVIKRARK